MSGATRGALILSVVHPLIGGTNIAQRPPDTSGGKVRLINHSLAVTSGDVTQSAVGAVDDIPLVDTRAGAGRVRRVMGD